LKCNAVAALHFFISVKEQKRSNFDDFLENTSFDKIVAAGLSVEYRIL
jgi:hypothetical protein